MDWVVAECDGALAERLADEAGLPRIVGRLLALRGVSNAEEAHRFLNPSLDHLHDPELLPDFRAGVGRLAAAVESGEKICVHGDYDVDGVTSTALMVRALAALGAKVDYRLPHRREGYDIKPAGVDEVAGRGARLIVTCDCGTSAHEAVRRACDLGIDVIVTDHHEPGADLPPALAVINPKRRDAGYPFTELAGVGVAMKFAQGLVRKLGHGEEAFLSRFTDLAALGTVGDVAPLIGENRAIVKHGLEAIPQSKKLGLQTMLRTTGLNGKPITAYYLAYVLGPRINAVGRMDDASGALRLLLTKDEHEASGLAQQMERLNSQRRAEQDRIFDEAAEQVEGKDLETTRVLVLSGVGWNSGVVGIVAGKICDLYNRPAILISRDEASGIGRGSARSIESFNLFEALCSCSDLLEKYGGHALAAGLSVRLDNLKAFEEKINAIGEELIPKEELAPRIEIDAEVGADEISRELAETVARLEPFGVGNPEPLFVTRNLAVLRRDRVGDGSHLKMTLQGAGCPPVNCIAFGMGDSHDALQLGGSIDLCYSIRLNTYNGTESVQLVVKAIG